MSDNQAGHALDGSKSGKPGLGEIVFDGSGHEPFCTVLLERKRSTNAPVRGVQSVLKWSDERRTEGGSTEATDTGGDSARAQSRVGGCGLPPTATRVPALVTAARHRTVYAHPGERVKKEQSTIRPGSFHVSPRKQPLSLSGGTTAHLGRKPTYA